MKTPMVEVEVNTKLKLRSIEDINEASDYFNAILAYAEACLRNMKGGESNDYTKTCKK